MSIQTGQQRRFPAVAIMVVLLALCIYPGQLLVTKFLPTISGLAQINPSVVFAEIPTQLPVTIDLILVPGLFLLLYPIVVLLYPLRPGILSWGQSLQRIKAAYIGLFILFCCVLIGGGIYYLIQNQLTTQVKNGINSIGFIADIHLAYRGQETIYLRGGLVLLICFIIGLVICIRKIRKEPAVGLTREQRMTPYERMLRERKLSKEQQMMLDAEMRIGGYHPDKGHKPALKEQTALQPERRGQSGFCDSQPVSRFRPEAIYFMPGR
ncbi:hypothetical protein A3860_36115 [Niastella vici]|uniref:Uncharacterized protein n=1 Tax=Niastella vici TaxID=1703345 RepID=A0A1V9FN59_9BACT|nr:hypothetical protein [Niastella vici]OQP59711.1 hypothetical protein A3860_36115 [Niastella vici]